MNRIAMAICIVGMIVLGIVVFAPQYVTPYLPTIADRPAGATGSRPDHPAQRDSQDVAKVLADIEKPFVDVRYATEQGIVMLMTPLGPCGSVQRLTPDEYAANASGVSLGLYPTPQEAIGTAASYCEGWYRQEKANRDTAQKIQQELAQNCPGNPAYSIACSH